MTTPDFSALVRRHRACFRSGATRCPTGPRPPERKDTRISRPTHYLPLGVKPWCNSTNQAALDAKRRQNMSSISTLLTRNLQEVFGENDPARRRAAIDEIYTEDGVFYDPTSRAHRGRAEIDRVGGEIRATHPEFRYQPIDEPEE